MRLVTSTRTTLAVALVLALASQRLHADAREEQAVRLIQKLGGELRRNEKRPAQPIVAVDLAASSAADADLRVLTVLQGLESLDLQFTNLTDAGLKHVGEFGHLRSLNLHGTALTDGGLNELVPFQVHKFRAA
jgi:hypothetical protein